MKETRKEGWKRKRGRRVGIREQGRKQGNR